MASMAHGRNYLIGRGHRGGPSRPRRMRLSTVTPDGRRVKLTMNAQGTVKEPVIAFLKENGRWLPKAVLDKNLLPDWANNYTLVEAREIRAA